MSNIPDRLVPRYESLDRMREMMEVMKRNQALRGEENLKKRLGERATRQTWRQMKGMQLVMHEINHPGNRAFVMGLGITSAVLLSAYFSGLKSEEAKKNSTYYQRFHAKGDHH